MTGGGTSAFTDPTTANILSSGMEPSFLSKLGSPTAIGAGLGASLAPPPMMKKEEDDFVAPRGAPISGKINRPMDDYKPEKMQSLIMGFFQTFKKVD